MKQAAHTIHRKGESARHAALESLVGWARTHGHAQIAELGDAYLHASLLDTAMVLPGPTGERNSLAFAPRGQVLSSATTLAALLNQLAACFATGNRAVLPTEMAALLPAGLPAQTRDAITVLDRARLADASLQIALLEKAQLSDMLPLLAARDGALVVAVETEGDKPVPLWRLVAERAVCVNTTAAGGNASLMTLGA